MEQWGSGSGGDGVGGWADWTQEEGRLSVMNPNSLPRPAWITCLNQHKLVPVISLVQVQVVPLQLLGLTPVQRDKCSLIPMRPPATKNPLQDAVEAASLSLHLHIGISLDWYLL